MTKEDIKFIIERSCLSKKSFSQEAADKVIERFAKEENRLFYYYKCQFCNSLHLTSKEPVTLRQIEVI